LSLSVCLNVWFEFSDATKSREADHRDTHVVTWFRVLTKKVLGSEEPRAPSGKDYCWYEMDFFARWSGANACRVLCVDAPQDVRERLEAVLVGAPKLELRDPFAMVRPLLDEVIKCCDDSTWRMTKQVRKVEKV
jgi:hypothetical protein